MSDFGTDYFVRRFWEIREGKVYAGERLLRHGDALSFEPLNYLYARDKSRVYYPGGVIKDADPSSFEALDSGARFSRPGKFLLNFSSFARDQNNVYHYCYTVGKPSIVRGADPPTFQSINGEFGRDKKTVYIKHRQIKNARVKSWTLLQGLYSCDDDFCFYGSVRIAGADRSSFICLPSLGGIWAKDRHRYYRCGTNSSQNEYFNALDEMIKHLPRVEEALTNNQL